MEATAQIVEHNPGIGVIILSVHSDEEYLLRALTAGAKGYLLKESADVDLLRAVQAVAQRKSFDLLTDREKEVFQLLAEGKSAKEIASILNLSPYTIETHRTHVMQKLDLHSSVDLVLYAVRKRIITFS